MMTRYIIFILMLILLSACSKPIANFMYDADKLTAPAKIDLENTSSNADEFNWNFGDGTYSDDENPNHTYSLSGRYVISLEAKKNNKISKIEKEIIVEAPKDCKVLMKTNMGDMVILLSDKTPQHRDNFIKLVNEKFYEGLLFHRVINGFMAQGGDPDSKGAAPDARLGSGGPGYTVPAEFVDEMVHLKGALAAARIGDGGNPERNSNGSQFYIVHGKPVADINLDNKERASGKIYSDALREKYKEVGGVPFLDHDYTVFGQVIEGLDVVDKIAETKTAPGDRPIEDVIILEVTYIN